MSDLQSKLDSFRRTGSLAYLAHCLGVTQKQITRYWDAGLIAGRYRTRKGHRRIRYDDESVENTKRAVRALKRSNLAIRYGPTELDFDGRIVSTAGCRSIHDLYNAARKQGLSRHAARMLAFTPPPESADCRWEFFWTLLHTSRGVEEIEIKQNFHALACVPFHALLNTDEPEDFRRVARECLSRLEAARDGDSSVADDVRELLCQPDWPSFLSHWHRLTEIRDRISAESTDNDRDALTDNPDELSTESANEEQAAAPESLATKLLRELAAMSENKLQEHMLSDHAIRLRFRGLPKTAAELARLFGLSRPALYRKFGSAEIRKALDSVRNSTAAIASKRRPARRKFTGPKPDEERERDW